MPDNSQRTGLIALLIKLAREDGDFNSDEERFLKAIARKLGIVEEKVEQIISGEIRSEYRPPQLEHERIVDFQTLVYFAFSDGELDGREVDFLRRSGMRLGIHPQTVSQVVKLTHQHYPETVPLKKLKALYMRHRN